MSDTSSSFLDPLKSFFFANDEKSMPQAMRQKIAMAMMLKQKRPYPKTFGEGLGAIGDAIGDRFDMRRLEREAADAEKVGAGAEDRLLGPPPAARTAPYAPTDDVTPAPAVDAISRAIAPTGLPPAAAAVPLPLDQQQSDEPGAPVRMTNPAALQDWRAQNPTPVPSSRSAAPPAPVPLSQPPPPPPPQPVPQQLPPDQPAQGFNDRFNAARPGQRSALEPPPGTPAMAFSGVPQEPPDARDAIARALVAQAAPGGPPPNPTTAAVTPPPGGQPETGIRPAPPATPPIGKAPQQAQLVEPSQADVGYATPMRPGPQPPPTMTPLMQRIQEEVRQTPPAYRDTVQQRLAPYYAQEQAKLAQQHEAYKDELVQHRALELKREDQLAARAKAILDAREQQQKIVKESRPPIEDIQGKMEYDPATGTYRKPQIAGTDLNARPDVKMNEGQAKEQKYHSWTQLAEDQFKGKDKILAEGYGQSMLGGVKVVGNALQSAKYRNAYGAAERWVQGFMRDISGAAIGTEEFAKHMRTFFPQPGDSQKDIADKRAARENAIGGMYNASGPGREISDWETRQRREAQAVQTARIDAEMGDKKVVGKEYHNKKTGKTRVWDGSRWEEY